MMSLNDPCPSRPRTTSWWIPAFIALAFLSGCADQTEVVVYFDTTLGVPCDIDTFEVSVSANGETSTEAVPAEDGLSSWTIARETAITGNGPDAFTVTLRGLKDGNVTATATANVDFEDRASRGLFLILDESCVGTTCDRSDEVTALATPDPLERGSCDVVIPPKVERYAVADQTGLANIINACDLEAGIQQSFTGINNEDVLVTDAELVAAITEGFDFKFFGQDIAQVWVSDDGYISFNASGANATFDNITNDDGITSPGFPANAVLGFWENLGLPATGQICVAMQQSGGVDTLWATWENACLAAGCAPTDRIEFSIGLEEGTDRVTIGFVQMISATEPDRAAAAQAVIGVMGNEAPGCLASECDADGFCADGETACGYAEIISRTLQDAADWPATFVLTPIEE